MMTTHSYFPVEEAIALRAADWEKGFKFRGIVRTDDRRRNICSCWEIYSAGELDAESVRP